jgi:DNA-binding transcriptional regulator YiaG
MMNPQKVTENSIYTFDPGNPEDKGKLLISLDDRSDEESSTSSNNGSTTMRVVPSAESPHQGLRWAILTEAMLTQDYLTALIATLKDSSSLPDLVTSNLFQHLLKVYRFKVETTIQQQGIDAIDTTLPHFKLISRSKQSSKALELALNESKIKTYLKNSLAEFFSHSDFWEEFARAIGTNLVIWAIERLESEQSITQWTDEQLLVAVNQLLVEPDSTILQERISFFGQIYCQDISKKIIQGFNLPSCSIQEMDKLMGLIRKPPTSTEVSLDLAPIAVVPTSIPIASSIRAQLRPDLWQQDANAQAVFQYRSRSNPSNYIEHYITNPGDIDMLPWEAAEQIINKFGFDTVKLQLIFAAQTMEQDEPWKSTFTLKATDIIHLIGWDKNHSTSLPDKRNTVASAAYALSCLLVKSVWVEGYARKKVDASTPIGRLWDVLIDLHGQIDWVTGKIEKPEEVYITVSPGLWTKHFLNRAGSKAKEALHQFGYLAKDILKIDPYHNETALRLAIQLTLDSRIRIRNQNPYEYKVISLLEEVLPKTEIEKALQDKHKARDLRSRWNKALQLLISLGWEIRFDPESYPEWLRPDSDAPRPDNWRKIKLIERLLQAKLTIMPPHPIPDLLARVKEPKKSKQIAAVATVPELTGAEIRQGRENRKWSRKELGGFLNLSADYVGKLERGDRAITLELEAQLRKLLHL